MSHAAYLIRFTDDRGNVVDAGVYSESNPTCETKLTPEIVLTVTSRFSYSRAARCILHYYVKHDAPFQWASSCPTIQSQLQEFANDLF